LIPLRFYRVINLLLIAAFLSCNSSEKENSLILEKAKSYPRWLKTNEYAGEQTSGIAFIGSYENKKTFLLADDIGKIDRLIIKDDSLFIINPIHFSKEVIAFLDTFPKPDFEEIFFDKYTNNVYLSIEGNGDEPEKYARLYKVKFLNNDFKADTIVSIIKLNFKPEELLNKYVKLNIAYEGATADKNYFYLGLEGFSEENVFTDSTIIFIIDKNNYQVVKEISTWELGIHTICGLYSDKDFSLYGIDRNNKKMFHILFDKELNIVNYSSIILDTNIPNYPSINYVSALESITIDDDNWVYLIDDPWKEYFIPPEEILKELDEETIKNFEHFVPVISRYKLKN
jgi:hypothetical protein